jgi:hypothetical protein
MSASSTPVKRGKAVGKPKIRLQDLDEVTYKALMDQAREVIQREKQPKGGEPIKVLHEGQSLDGDEMNIVEEQEQEME